MKQLLLPAPPNKTGDGDPIGGLGSISAATAYQRNLKRKTKINKSLAQSLRSRNKSTAWS